MIGFGNHDTLKHPLGFRWFSPSGEMPPLLFGGKAGTVMIVFGNHYTIFSKERQRKKFVPANFSNAGKEKRRPL